MDHPRVWLKYVEANDLDERAKLTNLEVIGIDGEKPGKAEGFIIDDRGGRTPLIVRPGPKRQA